jgi:putative transposase
MAVSIDFTPGRTIRWHKRRFVVVDHTGFDAILAREVGKRRIERLPVREVKPDHAVNKRAASSVNLVSIPEQDWRTAVKQFALLKPLLEMDSKKRTRAHVEKLAKVLRKHPATIYRWIEAYNDSRRVSAFLRKSRSDQGGSRLPKGVDEIIDTAINNFYLTAEQPHVSAVIEEVELQCFRANLKRPGASTIRRRVAMLSDRVKLEKRKGKKAAAEKYEPIRGQSVCARPGMPANNWIARTNVSMLAGRTGPSRRFGSRGRTVVSLAPFKLLSPHVPSPVPSPVIISLATAFIDV